MKRRITEKKKSFVDQISIEPSPFLPHTTIAIEKVKIAAKEAQANVKSI